MIPQSSVINTISDEELVWIGISHCEEIKTNAKANEFKHIMDFYKDYNVFYKDSKIHSFPVVNMHKFTVIEKLSDFSSNISNVKYEWSAAWDFQVPNIEKYVDNNEIIEELTTSDIYIPVLLDERHKVKQDIHTFDVTKLSRRSLSVLIFCLCYDIGGGRLYNGTDNKTYIDLTIDRDHFIEILLWERQMKK